MAHLQKLISSSSASPSTAATPNGNHNYDVFVNGHGQEVKKTLASHLHHFLLLDGFRVFDQQEILEEGVSLNSQIRGAIATASVHVAIFSPRFAESKWCLEELVLMLESGKSIIPVFYHVKPSDLRIRAGNGEDGVYGRALLDLEKKSRNEPNSHTVWREALSRVADISGLELEACNGDEGELVDRVVQLVEEKVIETQLLAAYPIGLDEKLEDFENTVLLQQQQRGVQTAIVGIVGSGGVGKTTVAMEFFKRKRSDYSRSCFLSDVKEAAGRNSLHSLQNQLIKDLTSLDLQIINVPDGKEKLSTYLVSSQALVILDDIDDVEQLLAFFSPRNDLLRSGSLILVVSRHRHVLEKCGIDDLSIYDLTRLNETHSQELFCLHAFHKRLPVLGFNEVVTQFLDACNGLPLFLKVFGALVYQKDLKYCETQLRKIAKILPATNIQALPAKNIQALKICYDSLDEQEKDTFLDIACFFINEDKDMAITIWDASGWEGRLNLENLQNYCLVDINSKNCIRMNDLLRDLGRDLAEKERFNCRLWRPTDNLAFHGAFQQSTVRGVNMVQGSISNHSFVDMSRLQLLRAEGDCLGSILNHLTHSDILWLCWNHCPYTSVPSWIPVWNLRVLQVAGGKLKRLWMDESKAPLELRELYISADVLRFPKSIGQLGNLEKIEAKAALIEPLPEEFCRLRSLKHLSLRTNLNLQRSPSYEDYRMLPNSFGNLGNLSHLDLSKWFDLRMLPDSFGNLGNLSHLDLSGCSRLKMLPDSFGNLKKLSHLDLSGCTRLETSPDLFENLSNLQHLDLSRCVHVGIPADSFKNHRKLQHLALPKSFRNPLTGTSTKKMVFKVAIVDEKSTIRAMESLAAVEGVESVAADMKEGKLTVVGDADPVFLEKKLRKLGSWVSRVDEHIGPAEEGKEKAVDQRYNEGKEKTVDQKYNEEKGKEKGKEKTVDQKYNEGKGEEKGKEKIVDQKYNKEKGKEKGKEKTVDQKYNEGKGEEKGKEKTVDQKYNERKGEEKGKEKTVDQNYNEGKGKEKGKEKAVDQRYNEGKEKAVNQRYKTGLLSFTRCTVM